MRSSFFKEVQHKRSASTLENYRKHLLRLELYNGGKSLFFEDIDQDWLAKYETTLREENIGKDQDRKLSNNYVHTLFKTLKVIFYAAIKKGIITDYPFDRYENPDYVTPVKDYLILEEIAKIEKFADETADPVFKQAVVYFLLGFSTGLRISEWFTFNINENIKDCKVFLRAKSMGNGLQCQ